MTEAKECRFILSHSNYSEDAKPVSTIRTNGYEPRLRMWKDKPKVNSGNLGLAKPILERGILIIITVETITIDFFLISETFKTVQNT